MQQYTDWYEGPDKKIVSITDHNTSQQIQIAQYGDAVQGTEKELNNERFIPSKFCRGSFTSEQYMFANSSYNYAVNIATNSLAQAGRKAGMFFPEINGINGLSLAVGDKIQIVSKNFEDLAYYKPTTTVENNGHFIALMVAEGYDYHWCRCDVPYSGREESIYDKWSYKYSSMQVANYDFEGKEIRDPSRANWVMKYITSPSPDLPGAESEIEYKFFCFMYVPSGSDII